MPRGLAIETAWKVPIRYPLLKRYDAKRRGSSVKGLAATLRYKLYFIDIGLCRGGWARRRQWPCASCDHTSLLTWPGGDPEYHGLQLHDGYAYRLRSYPSSTRFARIHLTSSATTSGR